MAFRPCIDLRAGRVVQIVGGTLTDDGDQTVTNHVSARPAADFATLYRRDGLGGGHVIMLEHPDLLSTQLVSLAERAVRGQVRDAPTERPPRTRRVVTNLDKRRRIEHGRDQRREERGSGLRRRRDDA